MTKKTETLTATEELERLNAFHAEQVKLLAARVEEERRAEVERKAAEDEKRKAGLRESAAEHGEYLISLSEKATKLTDELFRTLVERRNSADDFLAKYREIHSFGHHFHHTQNYKIGLSDILNLGRIDTRSSQQRFIDIDIRALHPVLSPDTMRKARA